MAKYYTKSGTLQMVVQADSPRKAALWAVHRTLEQVLPICDSDELTAEEKQARALAKGVDILDDEIALDERGFQRVLEGEAQWEFSTAEVVLEWYQLLAAVERIQALYDNASDPGNSEP